jgi:predicted dehydrogenase
MKTCSRRRFLAAAGAAAGGLAAPWIAPAAALGRDGEVPPSERIAIGGIGTGGRGCGVLSEFLQCPEARVTAACDLKPEARETARRIAEVRGGKGSCATIKDFRELVARPDIDVVVVASNDHWHVLHALAAVRAGKDIYVEKPLGVSIEELKVLREEVRRRGRMFQFGTQQRSDAKFRAACELVLNGRIGEVRRIRVSAPSGPAERTGSPTYEPQPVPEGFDYEMWLGPAPRAPFHPKRVVNPHWFHISDYSIGYIGGWGIHHIDIAQWGNGTERTGPVEIDGTGVFPSDDGMCDNPLSWDVDLRFAKGAPVSFTSDGGKNPHGIRFEGTEGWIYVNRSVLEAEPKSILEAKFGPGDVRLPASDHHQKNLLDSVRSRRPTVSPIEIAVRSDTVCHLADISMRLGRRLRWDPEKEVFPGDDEANRLLRRPMRAPWSL